MKVPGKHWHKFAMVIGLVVVFLVAVAIATSSHFWILRKEIKVARNGQRSFESSVYRSQEGSLLISVRGDENWYSFYPRSSRMGVCGELKAHIALHFFIYMKDASRDIPCVGFDAVKARDPELLVQSGYIEFTSLKNERVRVIWQ